MSIDISDPEAIRELQRDWLREFRAAKDDPDESARASRLGLLAGRLHSFREDYGNTSRAIGAIVWCTFLLGNVQRERGWLDNAVLEYQSIARCNPDVFSGPLREFTRDLKIRACHELADLCLERKRYPSCIAAVDSMLEHVAHLPQLYRNRFVRAGLMMRVEARRASGQLLQSAAMDLVTLIRTGEPSQTWPERWILFDLSLDESAFDDLQDEARVVAEYEAALASRTYALRGRGDRIPEPSRRTWLLNHALELCAGVEAACCDGSVPLDVALEYGLRARFDMGMCLFELDLWDEAALMFETAIDSCSRAALSHAIEHGRLPLTPRTIALSGTSAPPGDDLVVMCQEHSVISAYDLATGLAVKAARNMEAALLAQVRSLPTRGGQRRYASAVRVRRAVEADPLRGAAPPVVVEVREPLPVF